MKPHIGILLREAAAAPQIVASVLSALGQDTLQQVRKPPLVRTS